MKGNSILPLGKNFQAKHIYFIKIALRSHLRSDLACRTYKNDGALKKKHPQVCVRLLYKDYTNSRWIEQANGYSTTAQLRQRYTVTINSAHG